MSFFDGPGFRPHPEEPEALRARKRRDYQANVRLGQDFAVIRGWVTSWLRAPIRAVRRSGHRDRGNTTRGCRR